MNFSGLNKGILLAMLICSTVSVKAQVLQKAQQMGVSQQQMQQIKNNPAARQQAIQQAKAQGATDAQIAEGLKELDGGSQVGSKQTADSSLEGDRTIGNIAETNPAGEKRDLAKVIFGHEVFSSKNLTFAPNFNIATPKDYRLAPGDEIILNIWGASQSNERLKLTPEGSVLISGLGPVVLSGLSIEQAQSVLKNELSRIYQDLMADEPSTFMSLTLGGIRSIKVNMVGEVAVPGTYTLPSLASLFNALYLAGGVNDIGSLRKIKVYRNSREIANLDVYDYLLNGKYDSNIRLEDNDMVVVEPYDKLVQIGGKVKRGRIFELKNQENLADLIRMAGDFTGDAYTDNLQVKRKTGRMNSIHNVDNEDFTAFVMQDGDVVKVDSVLNRFSNRLRIEGAVYRPGEYAISPGLNTLSQLIEKAEGPKPDAFRERILITRLKPDDTEEIISINLNDLLNGTVADVPLQKEDIISIPSIYDMREAYTVGIQGAVNAPKTFPFRENMTVEDIVLLAGGLKEAASTVNVEISRRIKNPEATNEPDRLSQTFNVTLDKNLKTPEGLPFILEPFDIVNIRFSPVYHTQQSVRIEGEALFNGSYVMSRKNERLSELVSRAGGLTKDAYIQGASLKRKMSDAEKNKVETMLRITNNAMNKKDSISVESLNLDNYMVGIDLAAALKKPGSEADITLQEGDVLFIPQYQGTVKITGAVIYPNTVSYKKGASVKDYLYQAGGYTDLARKRPIVIYANGTVGTTKKRLFWKVYPKMAPGAEILVPAKSPSNNRALGLAEILSVASSTTSIAAMVTSLINNMK